MKKRDAIYLVVAVAILLVAGYLGYRELAPKNTRDAGVQVDKVGKIPDSLDETGLAELNDPLRARDFSSPVDLSGLNNRTPFGN